MTRFPWLALLFLSLCTAPFHAREDDEVVRLEAWPELARAEKKAVQVDIQRLREADVPEMAEFAREGLTGVGAGIVPLLLPLLAKEDDEDALERMREVLVAVTDARHTRLLATEFEHKSAPVRVFSLRRAGALPDAGTEEAADKALARVVAWKDSKRDQRKYTEEEHYAAALAATAAGSMAGLEYLWTIAIDDWGDRGDEMLVALGALRGKAATDRLASRLAEGSRQEKVAALNVLSGCGDTEHAVKLIKPFLDNNDNSLRVAAINALRGIVDGDPPIKRLSVFDAIEAANKWKQRV